MVVCVGRQQLSLCDRQKNIFKNLLFHFIIDDSFSSEKKNQHTTLSYTSVFLQASKLFLQM